tara:strand:- start:309 stop:617 length:309 start_codon:yes stop_codon:yes gene_type:complete
MAGPTGRLCVELSVVREVDEAVAGREEEVEKGINQTNGAGLGRVGVGLDWTGEQWQRPGLLALGRWSSQLGGQGLDWLQWAWKWSEVPCRVVESRYRHLNPE